MVRKALVGYSSAIGYYYDFASERGGPGPILEAPLSLCLLYDEVWFMERDLCPYNMRHLPYVHFVKDDLLPKGLPRDFLGELADNRSEFPWSLWKQRIGEAFLPGTAFDNHARSRVFGELPVLPTPGSHRAIAIDHYIASQNDFELVENSVNASWLASFAQSMLAVQTAERVLLKRLPSLQTLEGPHHPFVDELRSDSLLTAFRSTITEATRTAQFEQVETIARQLELEYDRISAGLAAAAFSRGRIVESATSLAIGEIPVVGTVVGAVQAVRSTVETLRLRRNHGWVGFIARAIGAGETSGRSPNTAA